MTLSIPHWLQRALGNDPSKPAARRNPARLDAPPTTVVPHVAPKVPRSPTAEVPWAEAALSREVDEQPGAQELYRTYARPRTSEMLEAIGLDVEYTRAQGDHLYYKAAPGGREVMVLDLLGGFGATLFGHNHPELCEVLVSHLRKGGTMHVQASTRGYAAKLAKRLSDRVGITTGRSYVTTFSNSGAESIEAALKHAEMELWAKRKARLERLQSNVARALHEAREGTLAFAPPSDPSLSVPSPLSPEGLQDFFRGVQEAAEAEASRAPVAYGVENAFHGKTLGALQLTYGAHYREPWLRAGVAAFLPPDDEAGIAGVLGKEAVELDEVDFDELGRVVLSRRRVTRVSACIAEPIQGEGGVRKLSKSFVESLRRAVDDYDIPLVFDEIQSGMGRTGTFLGSEEQGVRGDYYCFSKSLGGGLVKIGALLVDRERYQHDFGYLHTSTFAEDEVSCAVALKALDLLDRDQGKLMRDCAAKGRSLIAQLESLQREFPQVLAEVRGTGLLTGVRLASQLESKSPLLRVLSEQKLLGFVLAGHLLKVENIRIAPTLSAHETLRVEPSAYIGHAEIDQFIQAFRRVCALVARADAGKLCEFMLPDRQTRAGAIVTGGEAPAREAPAVTPARKVAFLAHFRDGKDLPLFEPGFNPYSESACDDFLSKTSPVLDPFVLASRRVGSPSGTAVELSVIVVPFTAAQASAALRSGDSSRLLGMLAAAVELAVENGAILVGCGAYTSILSDNCRQLARPGIGLTSGNSLTVAAAAQALDRVAQELGLRRRVLGVVGATGNIGATLAEVAADDVDEVVLVGRPGASSRLSRVASRIKKPVRIESSLEALRGCNLIATASNSAVPIIRPEHVGDEPVVLCDVAVPADVTAAVSAERPNARVVRGGLLKLPEGQDLQIRALDLPDRHVYACLAETLVLGLSGMDKMFSFGPLRPEKVRLIRSLAAHHGFTVDANLAGN